MIEDIIVKTLGLLEFCKQGVHKCLHDRSSELVSIFISVPDQLLLTWSVYCMCVHYALSPYACICELGIWDWGPASTPSNRWFHTIAGCSFRVDLYYYCYSSPCLIYKERLPPKFSQIVNCKGGDKGWQALCHYHCLSQGGTDAWACPLRGQI